MAHRKWILPFLVLGLLLWSCIALPQNPTRSDIDVWIEGLTPESITAVTTCIKGFDGREKSLPRQYWPEMLELVRNLDQETRAGPGIWELKGRLYISYGAGPRLEIDLEDWPKSADGPVIAWVQGGAGQERYNAFNGTRLWEWLSAATQATREGQGNTE